ncbi:MAG TPA: DUF3500 domain-containing protein [Acidimicrobiales bacterium]|nr:DUF3500 domain-containing protein [Acidimicrobiales bacterium]
MELRVGPPSSARFLGTPSERHQVMLERAERAIAEPLVGVVTSSGPVEGLFPLGKGGAPTSAVRARIESYASLLDEDARREVQFPLESDAWRRWSNIHRFLMRHGRCLDEMGDPERDRALELLAAALSPAGFAEARGVMRLNETIQEITGRRDERGYSEFGEWNYWLCLFGSPSADGPYGFQLDGHHLNLNVFVLGDQLVLTPYLLGSEPLVAEAGRYAGTRVLEAEERLALDLVQSLDPAQARRAVVAEELPPGLYAGAFCDNLVLDYSGIAHGELDPVQQSALLALIGCYVGRLPDGHAAAKMAEVRAHLDETYFTWMGATEDESVFYYRVHSPVLLVEFDHEPGVVFKSDGPMKSHIHTVMRTPNGNDYGTDLLRQHRSAHEHAGA